METKQLIARDIAAGNTSLGIEFGSTRIKAVLIDSNCNPVASGGYDWENQLENNIWTYSLEDIWKGFQESYREMANNVLAEYDEELVSIGSIGISAMMHGYMAFDKKDKLLVPFRTWRNSMTEDAEKELTDLFQYNIPQRWSIAHLYQAILNKETHLEKVNYFTTLAGYIHWQLTGQKVIGVGDASGMFPINPKTQNYDEEKLAQFSSHIADLNYAWTIDTILPKVLVAGEDAGRLTEAGAKLLDPSGKLKAGIPLCPPEGDAGTGMVATNSIAKRTGNVSAGTSVFAMIVLEGDLKKVHPEIDMVTTPTGDLVGMVHANNCSSDINAWVNLFEENLKAFGLSVSKDDLYQTLFNSALAGDSDCGGLLSYGYLSGENLTNISEGRPLFVRTPTSNFNLSNFMRVHLFSALGALKIGMDILVKEEKVKIDKILGHGGFFKTPVVGQKMMAAAMDTPVSVMETAGEGGAWGIALLASFLINQSQYRSLQEFLDKKVFVDAESIELSPDKEDVTGFETFIERYKNGLPVEQAAIDCLSTK